MSEARFHLLRLGKEDPLAVEVVETFTDRYRALLEAQFVQLIDDSDQFKYVVREVFVACR